MNVHRMLGSMIGGALGLRPKRHRRALNFLTGGRSSFLNTSTLLTAAGLAWGTYEVLRGQREGSSTPATVVTDGAPARAALPASASTASPQSPGSLPEGARRTLCLAIAAAKCDGELGEKEYARILEIARANGVEALVTAELEHPQPVAEIVAGVSDRKLASDLYALAFSIVRADEEVSGAERIWLARLATSLGFDAPAIERLERDIANGIARSTQEETEH